MTTKSLAPSVSFLQRAQELQEKTVVHRRTIHAQPELSFTEHKTAAYVKSQLESMGYSVTAGVGGTGLLAEFGHSGKIVGLRADMDALPIQETNEVPYRSQCSEVMHACGHDAHTACVLTAGQILIERLRAHDGAGRIRLLFQPAEERTNADGKSGATLMIEDGATKDLHALVGLHVNPQAPVGFIALREGAMLAACDCFDAVIEGKGCHGAEPEVGIDAIVLASQAVQAMQQVVSRRIAAVEPAVVTIGGIRSKTYAPNIVSESVDITGTVRYFNPAMHQILRTEIERALSVVEALGGRVKLDYRNENPPLVNDSALTKMVRQVAEELAGNAFVVEAPLHMGAEDFSFYTKTVPSCFFVLGVGMEGEQRELHTSTFDIDERALSLGAAVLAESAWRLMQD
jgi:amidohydrolase